MRAYAYIDDKPYELGHYDIIQIVANRTGHYDVDIETFPGKVTITAKKPSDSGESDVVVKVNAETLGEACEKFVSKCSGR